MTVYRLVQDGKLDGLRIARSYRIPRSAVDAYLAAAAIAPAVAQA